MNTYSRLDVAGLCDRGFSALALVLAAIAVQGQVIVTQSTAIAINDNAPASPYPSVIDLTTSRFPGLIQKVTVSVSGLTHPFAPDLALLLVGPNGNGVVLMSGAGANPSGNSSLNAADLTFSDDASSSLPASSALISGGVYKPTDNGHIPFPSPAPVSGYSSSLGAAFAMTSPNGAWQLFVVDTTAGPSSPITAVINSWRLSLFLGPEISNIPTLRMPEETTQSVNFTVADIDGVVTNVAATIPVNTNLVKITTTLNGTNVAMTVQGNFNRSGTNAVEVVAMDNSGFTTTNHFDLEVFFVCGPSGPPVFIPRQNVELGDFLTVPFSVYTPCNPSGPESVRASSDNQKLIPDANILIHQVGTNEYLLAAFPLGTVTGSANITIVADDGVNPTIITFNVVVRWPDPRFSSWNPITVNGTGAITPYPAINNVSGLIGPVKSVAVTLFNVSETISSDLTVLLVGPSGTNVLLMAGAGGEDPLTDLRLVFDNAATNTLPQASPMISGIYRPTAYGSGVSLPQPAPAPTYGTDLSVFKRTNPNGNWLLYLASDGPFQGSILTSWQLRIQTAPNIPPIEDQFTQENVSTNITIIVGDDQPDVEPTVTANADPELFKLPIGVTGSGATRTLTILPQPYAFGTNTITVTATDPEGNTASAQFQMGVVFTPQPPLFVSVPADQTLCLLEGDPLFISVWSPQGSPLSITAYSPDNPTLIPGVEVSQTGSENGTNLYSLSLIPAGVASGTATISIVASDSYGLKSSANFRIIVPTDCGFFGPVTGPISIPPGPLSAGALQQAEATPYPSIISVKGLSGIVTRVSATLIGLNHQHPEDLDIVLVSPDNIRAVMLMGHAGLGSPANSLRITFADNASPIPEFGTLSSQRYGPANYSPGLSLPLPAPPEPYGTNLSVFNGLSPNGDWQLYVLDDTYPTGGTIDGAWLLRLELAPEPKLFMSHNGDSLSITVSGATNSVYGLQSTLDLVNWSDAGNVSTGADGTGKFDFQIDKSATARFYRMLVK